MLLKTSQFNTLKESKQYSVLWGGCLPASASSPEKSLLPLKASIGGGGGTTGGSSSGGFGKNSAKFNSLAGQPSLNQGSFFEPELIIPSALGRPRPSKTCHSRCVQAARRNQFVNQDRPRKPLNLFSKCPSYGLIQAPIIQDLISKLHAPLHQVCEPTHMNIRTVCLFWPRIQANVKRKGGSGFALHARSSPAWRQWCPHRVDL